MGRLNSPYTPPFLAALILSLLLPSGCTGPPDPDWREVERAVDGDTLALTGGERVRLLGIDAPELRGPEGEPECWAVEASGMLARMVEEGGGKVRIQEGPEPRDRWGRTLAWVWDGRGRLLNEEMLREGCARRYPGSEPGRYEARLEEAAARAQEGLRGLWHPLACGGITPR